MLEAECKKDPKVFAGDVESREKILAKFELDPSMLRHYPLVIRAMYTELGEEAPEHLRPESADLSMQEQEPNEKQGTASVLHTLMEVSKDFEVPQVQMQGDDDSGSQVAGNLPDSPD